MENRNYTILKWCVVVLAVLNIALMVNMWMRPGHHGPPPRRGGTAKDMIIREVGFNDTQIAKYEELIDVHRAGMRELEKKGREIRENYFKLMASDTLDRKIKEELEVAIGETQKNIEMITFDHFKQVRVLCNDEQKKKFDNVITEVIQHMRGPHGPPPPR
jgi:periplasmic protein CpxP/Spy